MAVLNTKVKTVLGLGFLLVVLLLTVYYEPYTNSKIRDTYNNALNTKTAFTSVEDYTLNAEYEAGSLRQRLALKFPYTKSTEKIPKNIFQMWKTNQIETLDKGLQDLIGTWRTQENEDKGKFFYELIDDQQNSMIVNSTFKDLPEIVEAFHRLPFIVLKSDFLRYLLIFANGGTYSDIDTSLNTDLLSWMTYQDTVFDQPNQIGAFIGVESDRDEKSWARNSMARRLQYCQWTLHAKAGHPIFRETIARITELTLDGYNPLKNTLVKNGQTYDLKKGSPTKFSAILEWTGPAIFTDALFDHLNYVYKTTEKLFPETNFKEDKIINPNLRLKLQDTVIYEMLKGSEHNEYDADHPIGWQNLTKQTHPILFDDDVLIAPISYFNAKKGEKNNYVQHHFKGSWKS